MLRKGQRVQTPLGVGTIEGFEQFTQAGNSLPPADTDPENGMRVVVRLDQPENWIGRDKTPDPYIFRSQLSEIKED